MIAGPEKQGTNSEHVGYKRPPKSKRFKRGVSGNPNGRPRGTSMTAIIRRVLSEPDKNFGTKADALIAIAVKAARKGDFRFFKELIDRHDGKVPDTYANHNGEPLTVRVEYVRGRRHAND